MATLAPSGAIFLGASPGSALGEMGGGEALASPEPRLASSFADLASQSLNALLQA
jgi:hypothetical protein